MKLPKWLDYELRKKEARLKSIAQFETTYMPFKTRQEMWSYLHENDKTMWDYGSIPLTDEELSDFCMVTAWEITSEGEG